MNQLNNPTAQAVDNTLIYIFGFSLLLLLGITLVTIYFVIKYRRSKYPEPTSDAHGSWILETVWTVLPIIIVMTMFWYGWTNYIGLTHVPDNAMEVKATARMWSWQFEYPDGRKTDKLYVPVDKPVKVLLHSADVIHSFFAPAFRIKKDCVPGMETYVWFKATEPGSYDVQCAEYCGVGHAAMLTTIEALPAAEYAAWAKPQQPDKEPRGLTVLNEQGCIGCHSLDGSSGVGPSLYQLAGEEQDVERDGKKIEIKIDADYLKRSIREPNAEIVEGFQPMMPAYDQSTISDADLQAVVDYLLGKSTSAPQETNHEGAELIKENGCLGCHSTDGSESIAPTFKGLGGRQVTVERDGKEITITVDADYLRRSLLKPNADIVKDFSPMMPAADNLSPEEIDAIVNYLLKQ